MNSMHRGKAAGHAAEGSRFGNTRPRPPASTASGADAVLVPFCRTRSVFDLVAGFAYIAPFEDITLKA